jgi:hypothetical protein
MQHRDIAKLNMRRFPEQKNLDRDDVLIQLGDFGFLWHEPGVNREQDHWVEWLSEKNYTIAVVPGNHENYDLINKLETVTKFNGTVRRFTDNIFFLERGVVYNICNKSIFACGGAVSIDKDVRLPGVSWWPEEELSFNETSRALEELEKVNYKVDYVCTHTAPSSIVKKLPGVSHIYKDSVSDFLQHELKKTLQFTEWQFGHFHIDHKIIDNGRLFQCHYNNPPLEITGR